MTRLDCRGREALDPGAARAVAEAVRRGGLVAYPTDTLYGLGADPSSPEGVARVFRAKGRSAGKALPVLLAHERELGRFAAAVPPAAARLIRAFWPGALTLVLPARAGLPPGIVSDAGEVALRVPGSPLARSVLAAAGGALTGTSANAAGEEGAADPDRVAAALGAALDLLLDAGTLPPGRVSTLVRITRDGSIVLIREGVVAVDEVNVALKRLAGPRTRNASGGVARRGGPPRTGAPSEDRGGPKRQDPEAPRNGATLPQPPPLEGGAVRGAGRG